MTREIKFRGKRVDNGEWVHGYVLITQMSGVYIIGTTMSKKSREGVTVGDKLWQHEVDPATVGQYIGLEDKNGTPIYEGDRLRIVEQGVESEAVVKWCGEWDYPAFDVEPHIDCDSNGLSYLWGVGAEVEVIGNIYDKGEKVE